MYYCGKHINVVLLDNDIGVRGSVKKNDDDSYTVFINSRLSIEQQEKTYMHEIKHIVSGDFERENVQMIESRYLKRK